jgi:hypothetical protein
VSTRHGYGSAMDGENVEPRKLLTSLGDYSLRMTRAIVPRRCSGWVLSPQ